MSLYSPWVSLQRLFIHYKDESKRELDLVLLEALSMRNTVLVEAF